MIRNLKVVGAVLPVIGDDNIVYPNKVKPNKFCQVELIKLRATFFHLSHDPLMRKMSVYSTNIVWKRLMSEEDFVPTEINLSRFILLLSNMIKMIKT